MAKAIPGVQLESPLTTYRGPKWAAFSKVVNRELVPRIVLIAVSAFFLFPLFWMVSVALKSNQELASYPPTLFPRDIQWSNFRNAVETIPFAKYLRNTSVVTLFTVIGAAISNPIIAYGFSRIEWPGRDKVFSLVLATVFVPTPVLIVALFDIYARLGWVNTYLPLIVPFFFGTAFWVFLMRQFFLQIPQEISDAARIDGASELRILFQVIMPQSWPALGAVSLFAAFHAWNDFFGPFIFLTDEPRYTLALGLTFFQSQSQYDVQFNLLMAASILVVLPVVLIFLSFQRAFVQGVTVSGFK